MKRFVIMMFGLVIFAWSLSPAMGAMDERNIANLAEMLKSGKGFVYAGTIPTEQRQILFLKIGFGLNYIIEFRTRSCFRLFDDGVFVIDCDIIKKGYPLVAPLISW